MVDSVSFLVSPVVTTVILILEYAVMVQMASALARILEKNATSCVRNNVPIPWAVSLIGRARSVSTGIGAARAKRNAWERVYLDVISSPVHAM